MKWGVRKEYKPVGRSSKPKILNSLVRIRDKKAYETLDKIAEYAESNNALPVKYASETMALYKFENLRRADMRNASKEQFQNSNHNGPTPERRVNCFECTIAYEMRRRGYVVQANEVPGGFTFQIPHAFDVKDSFTIEESSPEACYKAMEKMCLSYGDGARGMLGIQYANYDSGHAMSWVVENGIFKIIDTQTDKVLGYDSFMESDGSVDVFRLDNAKVLPGVTDFVEDFEATEEEKEEAKRRAKELKKKRKEAEKERSKEIREAKQADKQRLKEWEKKNKPKAKFDIKKGVEAAGKAIKKFGSDSVKNVGNFISKGKEVAGNFLKNSLNIKSVTKSTTETIGFVKKG